MRLANGQEIAIERLSNLHDRASFDCGEESLNHYLRQKANQFSRQNLSQTYVAVRPGQRRVEGYFSVCASSIAFENLPDDVGSLPHLPIPALLLTRLAVDKTNQGQGLGRLLVFETFKLGLDWASDLGIYAIAVDALSAPARNFYLQLGFKQLTDHENHLFLPIKQIKQLRAQGLL